MTHEVRWGSEFSNILPRVAAIVSEGLDSTVVAYINDEVLGRMPDWMESGNARRTSDTYRVRFDGRLTTLRLSIVTAREFGTVYGVFESPDTLFIAAIRDVIRTAYLASLTPIDTVTLVVGEDQLSGMKQPAIVLSMTTIQTYGCIGYRIHHTFHQVNDTLQFHLLGVGGPKGICQQSFGPAGLGRRLTLSEGLYQLLVEYRGTTQEFRLSVTDSSTQLITERSTFIKADERRRWRYPKNSFALICSATLCDEVERWLLTQRGITRLEFPAGGVNPFTGNPAGLEVGRRFFRYETRDFLDPVRICFAYIEGRISALAGKGVEVRTWTGERATAWSNGSYRRDSLPTPTDVTTGRPCHPL